jgi:glycosyltransferase involved in cell wall biosynthesis
MKVVHIGASTEGGAGIAMLRLHQALIGLGIDSSILTMFPSHKSEAHLSVTNFNHFNVSRIVNLPMHFRYAYHPALNRIKLFGRRYAPEMFSSPYSLLRPEEHKLVKDADIVNLHWVSHFINWENFFDHIDRPIVWTMHDMNPFTGGCHHSFDCNAYKTDCRDCPQTQGNFFKNYATNNLAKKIKKLQNRDSVHIVSPSKWLGERSMESKAFAELPISTINNTILKEWNYIDKSVARNELGLPQDKKILLFVAQEIGKEFKGFPSLIDAVNSIKKEDIILLTMGNISCEIEISCEARNLGYIENQRSQNLAFAAADVLIHPSRAENFPNIILEAFASGTPVIANAVGGIPEMIEHGENGILTETTSAESLRKSILWFIDRGVNKRSEEISQDALTKYNPNKIAAKYSELYSEMLR